MNALALWVHTPVAQAVGWALIHFLWEGAALAAVLAAALVVLRPSSARARYAAACFTLLAMPLAFAITLVVLLPGHNLEAVTAVRLPNHVARISALPPFQPAPAPRTFRDFLPWLAPCWFLGVAFFYARGLAAWLAARRLRSRGICASPPAWQDRLAQLCDRMRLWRPVRLLESCFTDAPVLVGYLRPVILMPLGCLANLPAGQIECILIHELAHIRRHDYLVNLLQGFAEGLLFYHPAVWWASRVAREERENCCDDCVVEITGDARVYAATLAALEHRRALALEAAVAATGGNLMKRIRRLLTSPPPAQPSATPVFAAGLLLITCAAALAAWPAKPPARQSIPPVALEARLLESQTVEPQSSPLPNALRIRLTDRDRAGFLPFQVEPRAFMPQDSAGPMTDKERQAKQKQLRNELATPYRKWLNEDVAYIITDAERSAFLGLQTDEEREHFIEQFWLRRDPTPGTPENEFREEHYRRIAYANQHFASRIPGWKTDRGRIYITYGPPDEIEDHSSGGSYQRPASQGGGTTSTFPFQQWRYRFIEGIGTNIIIEFVDPTMTGEFRMTMDPSEKQAPLAVKGLAPLEQMGTAAARPAKTFRSDQDRRITIVTGGGSPSGNTGSRLNTLVITPDPMAGRFHITAEVTTSGGQTVQVVAQNVLAEISGPFVEWLELPVGSYILRATITDPNGVSKSSETRFTVD
ncbi:MAG: GWxTD domain-containing protein [Bryobacteraceae bacterium]